MKIPYAKRRYQHFMYLGLAWILLGIFQFTLMSNQWWLGLGWIVLGVFSLLIFIYKKSVPYITLDSEFIKKNRPFGKQIKGSDIEDIKYFSEHYVVISKDEELKINLNHIEENQIEELKQKLLDFIKK